MFENNDRSKKRVCKNVPLKISNKIKFGYGTVNKKDPKVIYIYFNGWLNPMYECDYEERVKRIRKSFTSALKESLYHNDNFNYEHISHFDLSLVNMSPNHKNYLDIQIFLTQKQGNKTEFNKMKGVIEKNFSGMVGKLSKILEDNDYEIALKKG
jgi:hypothetical protein